MRTYDDSFSGQKIYPGKVRSAARPGRVAPAHVENPQRACSTARRQDMGEAHAAGQRTGRAMGTLWKPQC